MSQYHVPVVWHPDTRLHDPRHEVWVGVATPAVEVADRVDAILSALSDDHRLVEATVSAAELLAEVHRPGLLRFLREASSRWAEGTYAADVGQERVVPYLFPTLAMTGGLPLSVPARVHAEAGSYGYDTMTLVGPGTWEAACAAASCAATAAELVAGGGRLAYALSRPPGHHATPGGYGGSCYLNNAAVAAALLGSAHTRVGIVDIDAHHGNGTAAIFWTRSDVLYGSVHVDPAAGWFPHYVGHASDTGAGDGRGYTRNLPLAPGTGDGPWLAAVSQLASWVVSAGCTALVVSLGVDAAADDPESPLQVSVDGYRSAGRLLGGTGLPAVVVQEGGYHLPTLGCLVVAYLEGHALASR